MKGPRKLLIMGFGGHARSAADVALTCGYTQLLFVDPNARPDEDFLGLRVLAQWDGSLGADCDAFAASGDRHLRYQQCQTIAALGLRLVSLISPLASVGPACQIGAGSFVGHHAHIGPRASIGLACIVNTGAIVEHDASVGAFSHVAVRACLAGGSQLGAGCMLGAGATVIDGLSVCDDVTIGAGAVVTVTLSAAGTYVGVPARRLA